MTLPIVGSRYGYATYGWRTSDVGGVHFNMADFFLFLDAIGITSTHRFANQDGTLINIRFPQVDADLIQLGDVTSNSNDGRHRVTIQRVNNNLGTNPFFWSLLGHTYDTKTQLGDNRSSTIGDNSAASGYFYACADNRGIAMFAATNTGLSTYSGQTSFHYIGYCDDPASVFYFGDNDSYPLDYIGGSSSGQALGFVRIKEMTLPAVPLPGSVPPQPVVVIESINCVSPNPDANVTDLMFRDNGATDYGTNYPLGRARPFLLFSNQNLAVNSLVRVISTPPTPEDHFHIVVSSVSGGGSILMPIITENYTLP